MPRVGITVQNATRDKMNLYLLIEPLHEEPIKASTYTDEAHLSGEKTLQEAELEVAEATRRSAYENHTHGEK